MNHPAIARPIQKTFSFGPVDHFDTVHGLHNGKVAVCFKEHWPEPRGEEFIQRMEFHADGRIAVHHLASFADLDVYMGMNGHHLNAFTRSIETVQVLTGCWCDLDYYKVPELAGLDALDVWERIQREHSWLPDPSLLIHSGRGAYLVWLFDERVHTSTKQKSRWGFAMRMLTELLRPYGADPQAIDAARVLRLVGSTNTKAGELVTLATDYVGRRVNFGKFTGLVLDHTEGLPSRHVVSLPKRTEGRPAKPIKRGMSAKADYRAFILHTRRLDDYVRLAWLRGGRLTDHRKRMAYWVACSLAWTCDSLEVATREMQAFILEHFADPDRYRLQAVANVLELMTQTNVVKLWKGEQTSWRHRARNQTIIDRLEITADEQAGLTELVSRERKQERQKGAERTRKEAKRRQQGMIPQAEYTRQVAAGASQRAAEARSMRGQGLGMGEIAARLGVSTRTLKTYFKRP